LFEPIHRWLFWVEINFPDCLPVSVAHPLKYQAFFTPRTGCGVVAFLCVIILQVIAPFASAIKSRHINFKFLKIMGKVKKNKNVITKGFSGKYSEDLVFRQVDNQTVFSRVSEATGDPSERQKEVRNKFLEASNFASAAIENPQAGQAYRLMAVAQKLKSAYVAAVTDYLTEPEIAGVFTNSYKGEVGNVINITSKYPYKITGIDVTILKADGTALEQGVATAKELKWFYSTTVANPQVAGCKLVLKSHDRQGKEFSLEKVL
jgi:hypothetical protein